MNPTLCAISPSPRRRALSQYTEDANQLPHSYDAVVNLAQQLHGLRDARVVAGGQLRGSERGVIVGGDADGVDDLAIRREFVIFGQGDSAAIVQQVQTPCWPRDGASGSSTNQGRAGRVAPTRGRRCGRPCA
jgi:hypothetical protein